MSGGRPPKPGRPAELLIGWSRHLYYWVYTPCLVGVTALFSGYRLNSSWPETFSVGFNSPLFAFLFCAFVLGVSYLHGFVRSKAMAPTARGRCVRRDLLWGP